MQQRLQMQCKLRSRSKHSQELYWEAYAARLAKEKSQTALQELADFGVAGLNTFAAKASVATLEDLLTKAKATQGQVKQAFSTTGNHTTVYTAICTTPSSAESIHDMAVCPAVLHNCLTQQNLDAGCNYHKINQRLLQSAAAHTQACVPDQDLEHHMICYMLYVQGGAELSLGNGFSSPPDSPATH